LPWWINECGKESEQGNPILRIGYREVPSRRQEEEVECNGSGDGKDKRFNKTPCAGDHQDKQQVRESNGRRIDGNKPVRYQRKRRQTRN
jgi:hypothetical protein